MVGRGFTHIDWMLALVSVGAGVVSHYLRLDFGQTVTLAVVGVIAVFAGAMAFRLIVGH